jgi:hypothetical protein
MVQVFFCKEFLVGKNDGEGKQIPYKFSSKHGIPRCSLVSYLPSTSIAGELRAVITASIREEFEASVPLEDHSQLSIGSCRSSVVSEKLD